MTLKYLQREAWQLAEDKGFHDDLEGTSLRYASLVRLCLIHTEVSECAQEIKRHGVTDKVRASIAAELADIVIRVCDFAETVDVDLQDAIADKMEQNWNRPKQYGTPNEEKGI